MLPQLVSPLIQLPLMNPQFLCQLLRADRLHSLHCSSLVFPTPPSISLPLLHSLLRGEFPCCLILGGQSNYYADSGSFYPDSVTDAVSRRQSTARAVWVGCLVSAWPRKHCRDFSTTPSVAFAPSVSAQNDRFVIHESDVL